MAIKMMVTRVARFEAGKTYNEAEVPAKLAAVWVANGWATKVKKNLGAAPENKAQNQAAPY